VIHPVWDDRASSSRSSEEDSGLGSSDEAEAELRNLRFRDLWDLYETTGEVYLVCLLVNVKIISFKEAVWDLKWKAAMDEEMKVVEKNETWEMTDLPKGYKSIGVKWVYKKKMTPQGTIERHKVRLIVKRYRQKVGIDYEEVFIPVAWIETIRLLISQAAQNEWSVHQMDVKLSFLNGMLEDKVYVEQPLRYMKLGKEHKVLKLKKALYGLKQASRARNTRIDNYFKKNGFKQCPFAAAIYVKARKDELLIITLYVDDLIFIGNSQRLIDEFKWEMKLEFEMKDFRMMRYFSLEIKQQKSGIFISQGAYAWEIL
jgi:Reverse transcriptase (RNA-dependent DNA polymerase)